MRKESKFAFYSGILLAIRSHGVDSFVSEGPLYQRAFAAAMFEAKNSSLAPNLTRYMRMDPVFSCYHESELMILYGMESRCIVLESPKMVVTRFTMSTHSAKRELFEAYERPISYSLCGERFKNVIQGPAIPSEL